MVKITFEIDGRPVTANNLEDAFEKAIFAAVKEQIQPKLAGIRDPETGECPIVAVRGRDLENLSFEVTGSPSMISLVKERLGLESSPVRDGNTLPEPIKTEYSSLKRPPCAFLCHASEDNTLARRIAHEFQTKGVDTFFDEWEIGPGDSLRQKIDSGIERCTHFVVLLTPNSLPKPWVNAEIDAGFVRKVEGQCRFIVLRYGIGPNDLPPLLRALYSPSLEDFDRDISALVNFIHGVTQKPPLGPAPPTIREATNGGLGLSPAAEMIVRLIIERSEHGDTMDPELDADELRAATGLHDDDIVDAVDELESHGFVRRHVLSDCGEIGFSSLIPEAALFITFDKYFKSWDPEADAVQIAADLVNGASGSVSEMAEKHGWPPRRMNPAVNYLMEHRLVDFGNEIGSYPWCQHWVSKNHATRRFVRDRS
jgi:hypothetical protein